MKVLLLSDVKEIGGRKGQIKEVAEGYARNYLLRLGLAKALDKAGLDQAKAHEEALLRQEKAYKESLKQMAKQLSQVRLEFAIKAGPKGALFGSVSAADIEKKLFAENPWVDKNAKVKLDKPIKEIGEHQVVIALPRGERGEITLLLRPLA